MSSLQQCFGLPADLPPFVCHFVFLIVHLLPFIWVMCPAHFHFILVLYWTMSIALALHRMMVLQILSFSLTCSIVLSMAHLLVSSFFSIGSSAFVRDHLWQPYVIAGKTHWLKTFLFRLMGRCLSRKISLYFPKTLHPTFFLIETSCLVLFSRCYCLSQIFVVTFSVSIPCIYVYVVCCIDSCHRVVFFLYVS